MTEKKQSKFSYFTELVDKLPYGPSRLLIITIIISTIAVIILSVPISNIAKDAYQIQQQGITDIQANELRSAATIVAHVETEKAELKQSLEEAECAIEQLHQRIDEKNIEVEQLKLQLIILAVTHDLDVDEVMASFPTETTEPLE